MCDFDPSLDLDFNISRNLLLIFICDLDFKLVLDCDFNVILLDVLVQYMQDNN